MASDPRKVDLNRMSLVGMKITATPMSSEIPLLWGTFAPRMEEVEFTSERGVSYGLMSGFNEQSSTFEYMAAVSVAQIGTVPEGMSILVIPKCTYAVFDSTLATLGATFTYIADTWLKGAGFQSLRSPYFERYDENFDPSKSSSKVEVFIPVRQVAK
jgi:AraC family transcriptional regulator